MPKVPDPFTQPEAWDRLVLYGPQGKATVPGVVRVSVRGALREQVAEVPGEDGATVTALGYTPAEVEVRAILWERAHFDKLRTILELWRPRRGSHPVPLEAVHPQLELLGVRRVYLFEVRTQGYDPRQGFRITLRMREWWPEKREPKRPAPIASPPLPSPDLTSIPTAIPPSEQEVSP